MKNIDTLADTGVFALLPEWYKTRNFRELIIDFEQFILLEKEASEISNYFPSLPQKIISLIIINKHLNVLKLRVVLFFSPSFLGIILKHINFNLPGIWILSHFKFDVLRQGWNFCVSYFLVGLSLHSFSFPAKEQPKPCASEASRPSVAGSHVHSQMGTTIISCVPGDSSAASLRPVQFPKLLSGW